MPLHLDTAVNILQYHYLAFLFVVVLKSFKLKNEIIIKTILMQPNLCQ